MSETCTATLTLPLTGAITLSNASLLKIAADVAGFGGKGAGTLGLRTYTGAGEPHPVQYAPDGRHPAEVAGRADGFNGGINRSGVIRGVH